MSFRAGGKQGSVTKCRKCSGSGIEVRLRQIGPGMMQQMQSQCSDCGGSGDFIREKDRCKKCKGKRVTEVDFKLEVCACGRACCIMLSVYVSMSCCPSFLRSCNGHEVVC